jgi:GNAT superfamily N-acetyltransferase
MAINITFKRTNSRDIDFAPLIRLLDADLATRYGDLQLTYNAFNIIPEIDTVVIAYADDKPVGCGCFKPFDDTEVEVKRMFVKPEARGNSIAQGILTELETWAKSLGYQYTVLELANKQPEAIGLYRKLGYQVIENYGPYIGMDSSICMRKVM